MHAIGVAVEALGGCRILHVGVHREKMAGHGVIATPVHVDEAEGGDVLVRGIVPVEGVHHVAVSEAIWVAAAAPGVIAQALHGVAVDGGPQAALVIL